MTSKETKPAEATKPKAPEARTANELCGPRLRDRALHAAAAQLHRWHDHRRHMNSEIKLTRADYEAAIKAASHRVDGEYRPHKPALFTLEKK